MTKVEALEQEVQNLSPEELAAFRDWFAEYDWQVWDRQLEQDIADGKLDGLAAEALAEFDRGETRDLSHHASGKFWRHFDQLTPELQQLARANYELLKANPQHPSLHFKRVGAYWSIRVGSGHRALGHDSPNGILWFWIGTHEEYERLIG